MKPRQFYGRLWFRFYRPPVDASPAPALRLPSGTWRSPARRRPSLVGPTRFDLLNEQGDLRELGWDNPDREKLWRYNQHYFDDLNAFEAEERRDWHRDLLAAWLAENPAAQGSGWEPYPTSLRIVNWIKWDLAGGGLDERHRNSLAVQARWLRRRLEWHLLGNHLFVNAKALIFAGLYFEGDEARRWLDLATRILEREIPEQVLADGGQFELSPMYHALALEDLLDLVNILCAFERALGPAQMQLLDRCRALVPKMRGWLDAMSHPDGEISFFNDAALDIAPANAELSGYAERLGLHAVQSVVSPWLGESGYARLENGDAVLIADMAAVGPDYLPGHAHADSLSFELSIGTERIIVNGGTSVYGAGPERQRQRGTAAHSTVTIAGRNSSDVWSGFRVGRRARVSGARVSCSLAGCEAEARHDGYRTLPGHPEHARRWFLGERQLRVIDRISPAHPGGIARYHLHPSIRAVAAGPSGGTLHCASGRVLRWSSSGSARLEDSSWHPRFGQTIPTSCIAIAAGTADTEFTLSW
ncbi:heparinase II/III domain-containing protein [Sphingomonas sp. Root241]|uniref:heparinase II/III family protein n=1 Tax=Sphingomonas sp. Root241 TaxID=1736501 RepID=UPI0006F6E4AA|nr:heparinase II/III family protein [Sphingomonas sp. Root241]KRC81732.1 heparinase [Sphingomonas sp. Root241]